MEIKSKADIEVGNGLSNLITTEGIVSELSPIKSISSTSILIIGII